jgi:hypothetical protein
MQQIIEFKKRSFWTSELNLTELNSIIESLNRDGWKVTSVIPIVSIFGVHSYTLLLEK